MSEWLAETLAAVGQSVYMSARASEKLYHHHAIMKKHYYINYIVGTKILAMEWLDISLFSQEYEQPATEYTATGASQPTVHNVYTYKTV